MTFLSLVLGFIGYTLVYAASANHGRFASTPWTGVLADAYDGLDDALNQFQLPPNLPKKK